MIANTAPSNECRSKLILTLPQAAVQSSLLYRMALYLSDLLPVKSTGYSYLVKGCSSAELGMVVTLEQISRNM